MGSKPSFDEMLLRAIEGSLEKMFGPQAARAVRFYADSRIAQNSPRTYEDSLRKIFKGGAKLIIDEIEKNICALAGLEHDGGWGSLEECVSLAKNKYSVDSSKIE